MADGAAPQSSIILYQTEDGQTCIECRFQEQNVWLSQIQMAKIFLTEQARIHLYLKTVYQAGELTREATRRSFYILKTEGKRQLSRHILHFNLEAILAVGHVMRSPRVAHFEQWARARLAELRE